MVRHIGGDETTMVAMLMDARAGAGAPAPAVARAPPALSCRRLMSAALGLLLSWQGTFGAPASGTVARGLG